MTIECLEVMELKYVIAVGVFWTEDDLGEEDVSYVATEIDQSLILDIIYPSSVRSTITFCRHESSIGRKATQQNCIACMSWLKYPLCVMTSLTHVPNDGRKD